MYKLKETSRGIRIIRPNGTLVFIVKGKTDDSKKRAKDCIDRLNSIYIEVKELRKEVKACRNLR